MKTVRQKLPNLLQIQGGQHEVLHASGRSWNDILLFYYSFMDSIISLGVVKCAATALFDVMCQNCHPI